jgi:hypothetical protein
MERGGREVMKRHKGDLLKDSRASDAAFLSGSWGQDFEKSRGSYTTLNK